MAGLASVASLALVGVTLSPALAQDEVSASMLVRVDSDNTQVITPRAAGRFFLAEERISSEISYAADVWSSASVDMRTAATARVTEQRDELNFSVAYEGRRQRTGLGYRLSHEPDYMSNGVALVHEFDFAEKNATLATTLAYAWDRVGRAGDSRFRRRLETASLRVALSQIASPRVVLQAAYELTVAMGFQASPYRFVGVGGDGACGGTARYCFNETHPDQRLRHAVVLRMRYALSERMSLSLDSRYYIDSWSVQSGTAALQWTLLVDQRNTLLWGYRAYGQSQSFFYEERYADGDALPRYVTRDKELSRMNTQRLTMTYAHTVLATEPLPPFSLTLSLGATRLHYSEFLGLSSVYAGDLIAALAVEL